MKPYKLIILMCSFLLLFVSIVRILPTQESVSFAYETDLWDIQSVDTVKYSRDLAREKADLSLFDAEIEQQVASIAAVGASHVAIGTPYDEEFLPFMKRWIAPARKYGLNVWFRGNFSGWERWFGYQSITSDSHTALLSEFIRANGDLFENSDVFDPCTECENGGAGDPRRTGDVTGYRAFLIDEHRTATDSFRAIGKNVRIVHSMNGDVARLIMDKETTQALGGVVTIDHYVKSPQKLAEDVESIASASGGTVILGEFGAPVPDLHGNLDQDGQEKWINETLTLLAKSNQLTGINYWTGYGGSTRLWEQDGTPRKAVSTVQSYYNPRILMGTVTDEIENPIVGALVTLGIKEVVTDESGAFVIPYVFENEKLIISAEGYNSIEVEDAPSQIFPIVLFRQQEGLVFKLQKLIHGVINK
ncbi:carboxypeptidase regulatory-like domain-containing protein [Candidatus Roizmanbacteria bacterium]|nr:carboxypeptidase regulatory-like domain-containing protein [Candidatus Roizmanbacteria bacterium]